MEAILFYQRNLSTNQITEKGQYQRHFSAQTLQDKEKLMPPRESP